MVHLRPTNGWDLLASLGHPCKFQRLSRLGSITAWHSSSGRQPNFAALNRGCHLYLAGRPSRWAFAHILVWEVLELMRSGIWLAVREKWIFFYVVQILLASQWRGFHFRPKPIVAKRSPISATAELLFLVVLVLSYVIVFCVSAAWLSVFCLLLA